MSGDPIEIEVTAPHAPDTAEEIDEVTESLERLRGESDRLKDSRGMFADDSLAQRVRAAKTETQGLSQSMGQLRTGLAAVGFTRVISEIRQLRDEGQQLANAQALLGSRSNALARDVTQSLVPSLTLATTRGAMLTAGLRLTDQQFAAVAAGSQAFAHRTGTSGTQAVERLSQALISGSREALIPFGVHLRQGQTGADAQREAIRQLTSALEANRAAVAATTTNYNRLEAAYQTGREYAGQFYDANARIALDALPKGIEAAGRLVQALAGGQSVQSAFRDATQAGNDFASSLPLIGSAIGPLVAQMRELVGLGRQVQDGRYGEDIRAEGRAGGATSVTATSTDYSRPRNRAEWARARELGLVPAANDGPARRRRGGGGGGGGGGRRDDPLDISRREVERIEREQRERDEASMRAWGERYDEAQAEQEDARLRRGPGVQHQARVGATRQGSPNGPLTQGADPKPIDEVKAAYERLRESATSVLADLGEAWKAHFAAFSKGEESFKKAMKGMAIAALEGGAKMALQESIIQTGRGFAALASFNYGGAALHFTAAAVLATVAGGAYALSGHMAGSGGRGGAARAGSPYDRPERTERRELAASAPPLQLVFNMAPGSVIGGGDERTTQDWLTRQVNEGLERNGLRRAG